MTSHRTTVAIPRPQIVDDDGESRRTARPLLTRRPSMRRDETPTPIDPTTRILSRVIDSRYVVERFLGRGGSGIVVAAFDRALQQKVAIKVLTSLKTAEDERRFCREVEAMQAIRHPGLACVLDWGRTEHGERFIVMELVEAPSLRQVMDARGADYPEQVVALLRPIAEVTDAMHRAGLVHRDIKPENILVPPDRRGRLIDLGIAFPYRDMEPRLTEQNVVVGSPRYLAPEAARGETPGPLWDIYALGVIAFEMMTGAPPFRGTSLEVMQAKAAIPAPWMAAVAGRLFTLDLEAVMRDVLSRTPSDRPSTATALLDGIERSLDAR